MERQVEARESPVDRNSTLMVINKTFCVEARESPVDRNVTQYCDWCLLARRGSREPCGSKSALGAGNHPAASVEARESPVDRNYLTGRDR